MTERLRRRRRTRKIHGETFDTVQQAIIERLKLAPGPVGSVELMRVVTAALPQGTATVTESHVASLIRRINKRLSISIKSTRGTGGGYERRLRQCGLGGPFKDV